MKTRSVLIALAAVLSLAACTVPPARLARTVRPRPEPIAPPAVSMPPTLTAGAPLPREQLPRGAAGAQVRVLLSRRFANVRQASVYAGFTPRLPKDTGGASLRYLLVRTPGPRGARGVFRAEYSDETLLIAEWHPLKDERWQPHGMVATQTVHGLPATVNARTQDGRANVLWKEDGIMFNVWYVGSLDDALRIAESFPTR